MKTKYMIQEGKMVKVDEAKKHSHSSNEIVFDSFGGSISFYLSPNWNKPGDISINSSSRGGIRHNLSTKELDELWEKMTKIFESDEKSARRDRLKYLSNAFITETFMKKILPEANNFDSIVEKIIKEVQKELINELKKVLK